MSALDKCIKQEIDIRGVDENRRVPAHRFNEFAVHKWDESDPCWRISHLPTGLLLAKGFGTAEDAAEAMIKVAAFRKDWATIKPRSITQSLQIKLSDIVEECGGYITNGSRDFKAGLNGYK